MQKQQFEKCVDYMWKVPGLGDSFLILKHLLEWQGLMSLSRMEMLADISFASPSVLLGLIGVYGACLLRCPTRAGGCAECKQGILLYHLALVPGVCIPESQGTVTIRNTVLGGCHHQGTAQAADWNPSPVFLGKKLFIPESPAESQKVQICYTRASEVLLESKPNNAILYSSSASLQLARSSQKGTCTLIWIIHFCNWHPGDTCRLFGLEGSSVKVSVSQDCPGSPESPK